jgi:predicted nucleotidyltransferase
MDINHVKQPLTQFLRQVSKQVKVDQMLIFGSYAKGTATLDSDIDVVVVSEDFARIRTDKRLRILDTAARDIEPVIIAAGFTNREMQQAGKHSILGQARTSGVRFV